MNKALSILKRTLKTILWVIVVFVFLFLSVAGIIQIPAIQAKIVLAATNFVSSKTHTRVEIKKVSISFPKSLVIEGLFLDDLSKDTLIYAGKAKVNVVFKDLLFNKICINNIELEDLKLNVHNTKNDSLFNYNFLLIAFADTTNIDSIQSKTPSAWTFTLDQISLKNIQLRYNDEFGGMNLNASLEKLEMKLNEINFQKSIYAIDDLLVENLKANLLIIKSSQTIDVNSRSVLPTILANTIQINNSSVNFIDSINNQSVRTAIQRFELKKGTVNLQKEIVNADKIYLSESEILYKSTVSTSKNLPDSTIEIPVKFKNEWKVTVKEIDFNNNSMSFFVIGTPVFKNTFDYNHMYFSQLNLKATELYYCSDSTKVSVDEFNAIDCNNFAITRFETIFKMDNHSITVQNVKFNSTNSNLVGDASIQFKSLNLLTESLPNMILNVNIKKSGFSNSDILYFAPSLSKINFFKNKKNITNISGVIFGQLNNLKGKNVVITTANKTLLESDFSIVGLPNAETVYFVFPNMKLVSGKKDLQMIAGSDIPKSLKFPEDIELLIHFKGKLNSFETALEMNSTFGAAKLVATLDSMENFSANITTSDFDLGGLLENKAFGATTLAANIIGHGLDPKIMKAQIKANVSEIYLSNYNYHNLTIDGTASGKEFNGKVNLNDKNAVLDFDGLVNMTPNQERYKFQLNVQGVNLQNLNFTKNDIRLAMNANADLKGGTVDKINGFGAIYNLTLSHNNKKYVLDSVMTASVNQPNRSEMSLNSALIGLKYNGTLSPSLLPKTLTRFVNKFFPFSDKKIVKQNNDSIGFNFEIQLHNHPVLSEVLLPELKEFEPGIISGSFDSWKNELKMNALMKRIVYGSTEIDNLALDVLSDSTAINYKLSSSSISNSQVNFANFLFHGKLADNKISANLSSVDGLNKKLAISTETTKKNGNYKLVINPNNFFLMNNRWKIADDNYIEFGKPGFLIHHLFLNNAQSQMNIASVHDKFNDDLDISIKNFKLDDISGVFEKDTSLIKGNVDGNVLLKSVNNSYGIIAEATINKLIVKDVTIGNLTLKAKNSTNQQFDVNLLLHGTDNNLTASGFYIPNNGDNSIHLKTDIQSLNMKTVEAFSMGQISKSSGILTGSFLISGKTSAPELTGQLTFNDVFMTPSYINNRIELKHESIQMKSDGVYFNKFTVLDSKKNAAILDGAVHMKQFSDFVFALHATTNDFLLFKTTWKDNKEFYGRMIIDSKIDITGPMAMPHINAKVKMKKGSNFTFAVPDDELTTDKGENVVQFEDKIQQNTILNSNDKKTIPKFGFTGFDLTSIIEVDKEATLKLLMDPTSSDSLVVKGQAALSFSIDRSGKMSLTGAYNLNEGSYLISMEQVIKRKFDIIPGSTIIWNGDPLDANISINATYDLRAAPYDLVANQMDGLSDKEKAGYKQLYSFQVLLKLRGAILKPEISFEIQLLPEDKGILGGAVNQKLNILNEDPSSLNKQVFALLILGRFVQENPLQSESGGTSTFIRSTVSNFLSTQLNQLTSKFVPGVEMNFDIKSYDDYQSGTAQGRTQVGIGLKKQLFNERLSVLVGGNVDVEGAAAKQNSASNLTGDVTVEYKLTKDGRFLLKGFRHNQYEGAIEGQLIETGAGVVYVKDFNKWKNIMKKKKSSNR
jgi:hypothetical protein